MILGRSHVWVLFLCGLEILSWSETLVALMIYKHVVITMHLDGSA